MDLQQIVQKLQRELTCSICSRSFLNPTTVACGHNFCHACLVSYWGQFPFGTTCPECQEEIPQLNFIPNVQLTNITKLVEELIINIKQIATEGLVCKKHPPTLKAFCRNELVLFCSMCDLSREHLTHDVVPVPEAAEEYKGELLNVMGTLKNEKKKISEHHMQEGTQAVSLMKQIERQRQFVTAEFNAIRQFLEEQEKYLLLKVLESLEKGMLWKKVKHAAILFREASAFDELIQTVKEKCQQSAAELLQVIIEEKESFHYYKPGDYWITGIMSGLVARLYPFSFSKPPTHQLKSENTFYHILPFLLAVHEVNQNSRLLSNVTLGYNIYENFFSARMTYEAMLDVLSTGQENIPNYRCGKQKNLLVILEEMDSELFDHISNVLSIYKYPQINYSITNQMAEQNHCFPFSYRMTPNQEPPDSAIIQLLLDFQWTWIGLLSRDNERGEKFKRRLEVLALKNGICIVLSGTVPEANLQISAGETHMQEKRKMFYSLMKSQIKIIVCQLDFQALGMLAVIIQMIDTTNKSNVGRVWIATTLTASGVDSFYFWVDLQNKYALFSFLIQSKRRTQYDDIKSYASMVISYGKEAFQCSYSSPVLSKKVWKKCREKENWVVPPHDVITRILSQDSSSIFQIIQIVAWVLSAASSSQRSKRRMQVGDHQPPQVVQPWQLHRFLRNFHHHNISRDGISFDENGVPVANFDIMQWTSVLNKSDAGVKIGTVERQASLEVKISVNQSAIQWPTLFNKVVDAAWILIFYLSPYVEIFLFRNNSY